MMQQFYVSTKDLIKRSDYAYVILSSAYQGIIHLDFHTLS